MRRTPPWVFVAAAGIELAVLLLCVWGMEQSRHVAAEAPARPLPPPEPEPEPEPVAALDEPRIVQAVAPLPPGPVFGPPPERPPESADVAAVPAFVVEPADASSQIVGGRAGEGRLAFGFYADGNMRFVDVDGGRYAGKVESARARLREVDGTRAFTVQIGVGADQRLQATFTGGAHDTETIALEPLVGWSVA
ncbi:MAG TPA: hypothetical protein VGT98_06355 [Candidatus Elarobacter sp.]|nr:hypothetical protein [Candidatus Elarobacter sp.]HEV2740642.1 hypothetical protein [Candidatus Elarobacter sp.]